MAKRIRLTKEQWHALDSKLEHVKESHQEIKGLDDVYETLFIDLDRKLKELIFEYDHIINIG